MATPEPGHRSNARCPHAASRKLAGSPILVAAPGRSRVELPLAFRRTVAVAREQAIGLSGVTIIHTQDFGAQPGSLNPFGCKDGIGQPSTLSFYSSTIDFRQRLQSESKEIGAA
jgi:hypothetical protein